MLSGCSTLLVTSPRYDTSWARLTSLCLTDLRHIACLVSLKTHVYFNSNGISNVVVSPFLPFLLGNMRVHTVSSAAALPAHVPMDVSSEACTMRPFRPIASAVNFKISAQSLSFEHSRRREIVGAAMASLLTYAVFLPSASVALTLYCARCGLLFHRLPQTIRSGAVKFSRGGNLRRSSCFF